MRAPAMRATRGLQTPHVITTVSASISPAVVRTQRTRPCSTSIATTSVFGTTCRAPVACARSRMIVPARKLLHPLLRARDLDAARLGEDPHLPVLVDAFHGEGGHLLRVVDQVDEVRGVARGSTGVRKRTLVDEDDVPPAQPAQVLGPAVADDAAPDHDSPGVGGQVAHRSSLSIVSRAGRARGPPRAARTKASGRPPGRAASTSTAWAALRSPTTAHPASTPPGRGRRRAR